MLILIISLLRRKESIGVFQYKYIIQEKMTFDFKKEFKEFYMPKNKPEIVTVPKPNSLRLKRACSFRLCTTDLLMMNPQLLQLWINFLKIMDIAMTLAMADFTMKSICLMQEKLPLRSGWLWSDIQYAKRKCKENEQGFSNYRYSERYYKEL